MRKGVFKNNDLLIKLVAIFILGIATVTVSTLAIVIWEMNIRYVKSFSQNNYRIIERAMGEMSFAGEAIIKAFHTLRSSWEVRAYIEDVDRTTVKSAYAVYGIVNRVSSLFSGNLPEKLTVVIVGTNGETYLSTEDGLGVEAEALLAGDFTRAVAAEPNEIHYRFLPKGFTWLTARQSVFVAASALSSEGEAEPYAFAYIIIDQERLLEFYRDLSADDNVIMLIDNSGVIVSSPYDEHIGADAKSLFQKAEEAEDAGNQFFTDVFDGRRVYGVSRPSNYWPLRMVGLIYSDHSNELAAATRFLTLVSVAVAGMAVLVTTLTLDRLTRPLRALAEHMGGLRMRALERPLPVKGAYEIRELIAAYNVMIDDIENYISRLKESESQKRRAEIMALQTQIKPHFIYNTLTLIKWFVWSGESQKASNALDSFTMLIKNMIGDNDEMITLRDEIENLRNYVVLQQMRFGGQIKVMYNVDESCMDLTAPRLILQPFIENAFFHAYPGGQGGIVNVFVSRRKQTLVAEIIDDGVGMSYRLERADCAYAAEKCGFHGIGISNVDERLKLLFGQAYGVAITSESGRGTIIRITMPLSREQSGRGAATV
jgi:two-component system sensor histidine kinase YesM